MHNHGGDQKININEEKINDSEPPSCVPTFVFNLLMIGWGAIDAANFNPIRGASIIAMGASSLSYRCADKLPERAMRPVKKLSSLVATISGLALLGGVAVTLGDIIVPTPSNSPSK